MNRSKGILAVVVIVLVLLAYFLLLNMRSDPPASHAGQAAFVGTSGTEENRANVTEQGQRMHTESEATRLPSTSNSTLRRGVDERFPARLDLLVSDATTHLPIPAVTVTAVSRATEEKVAEQVLAEGRGTIDLPTGALFLTFEHPDYEKRRLWIEFTGAQISRKTIELKREVHVLGTVYDQNGAPVSGATILFPDYPRTKAGQIVTGADGRFDCRLPPGRINGVAFKGTNTVKFTSEVAPVPTASLDVTLPITSATISFTGRILNQKGEPVEGAVVGVEPQTRPGRASSQTTEEDGTFDFILPSCVAGLVTVKVAGARLYRERVPLSGDLERELVVDVHPAFTVTLLTPGGSALTKGFRVEGVGPSISKIFKLPDGRYYSTAYPVDIHAIAVESGYGNSEVIRLSGYENEVILRIEPGGNLLGRVVDPSGRPLSRFNYLLLQGRDLYVSQTIFDSPDGSFAVRHVTPGRYTLRVAPGDHAPQQREIVIEQGRDCFVEMVLP